MNTEEQLEKLKTLAAQAVENLTCFDDGYNSEFVIERTPEGWCSDEKCVFCQISRLLPPFKCNCGKFFLNRNSPSMWSSPVNHTPEKCAEPPKAIRCPHCDEVLPRQKHHLARNL